MLIHRLSLKNFRCHRDAKFEFKEGINLILGKNGAGKSSIVEAIGLALIRGQKTRDSLAEAVSKGAKRYEIELIFEGADGIMYRSVRKSGSNPELFLLGENAPLNANKLPELVGLDPDNAEALYSKVVYSRQNEIISLFDDTSGEIKKQFDKVFNTEIYGKLASESLKGCFDTYKAQASELEGRLAATRANLLGDREEKEAELVRSRARLSEKLASLESVKTELGTKQARKNELEELARRAIKLEGSIKALRADLAGKSDACAKARAEYLDAGEAAKIVEARAAEYQRSMRLDPFIESIGEDIKRLEEEQKKLNKLKESIKTADNELTRAQTNRDNFESQLLTASVECESEAAALKISREELAALEAQSSEVNEKLSDYKRKRIECDALYEKAASAERERAEKIRNADERAASLADDESLKEKTERLESELKEIDAAIEELGALESKLDKAKARLEDNAKFREALADGFCRILSQRCDNVTKGGANATEKFNALAGEFEAEIIDLTEKIRALGDPRARKIERSNRKAEIARSIEANKKESEIINKLRSEAVKCELISAKLHSEIKAFALESYREFVGESFSTDKFKEDIVALGENLNAEAAKLAAILREKRDRNDAQSARARDSERKAEKLRAAIRSDSERIEKIKSELDKLAAQSEAFRTALEPLEGLKESREKLLDEKRTLAQAVDEYSKHINMAGRIVFIAKQINDLERNAATLEEELAAAEDSLREVRETRYEEEATEVERELSRLTEAKEACAAEALTERNAAERLVEELSRDAKTREKLAELAGIEKRLGQKRALLEKLRENVKSLGPGINRRIVASIEAEANNYLAALSDSGGKIIWETENGSYAVKLANGAGETRGFKSLSGGEQVSVALALRAAMANLLTKSDFAIFDEPTNNLDSARREALRESLGIMLNRLRQAIIITHDDTFEGCENNAVRLGETVKERE